jgi:hypothetical protein
MSQKDNLNLAALYESLGEVPLRNVERPEPSTVADQPDWMKSNEPGSGDQLYAMFPKLSKSMEKARYGTFNDFRELSQLIKQTDSILDGMLNQ